MTFKRWRSNLEIYGIPALTLFVGLLVGFIGGKEYGVYQVKQAFTAGVKEVGEKLQGIKPLSPELQQAKIKRMEDGFAEMRARGQEPTPENVKRLAELKAGK